MGIRKRRAKKTSRTRRWLFRLAIAVIAFLALGVALTLPLRWFDPQTTAFMLGDRSGRDPLLHEWRDWEQLGPAAALAVVAAEDQRFDDHFGLDVASIRDSIERAQGGSRLRGASTISQQVAKNLYLWPGRSFVRKGLEAWFTLLLEACLPKKRILEITNLYDRANPCCTEYSLLPDGSLASREAHWLPLVPSLGAVWRF